MWGPHEHATDRNSDAGRAGRGRRPKGWLFGLSDEDYQAFARGHHGAGVFNDEHGRGMVNAESIGGNLIVQHYRPVRAGRGDREMHSRASRVYLLHLVPYGHPCGGG